MLRVYNNNATDWVIAKSPEDALKVWCETTGEDLADYIDDDWTQFTESNPETPLSIIFEDAQRPYLPAIPILAQWERYGDFGLKITALTGDWAKAIGKREFLCSTEW